MSLVGSKTLRILNQELALAQPPTADELCLRNHEFCFFEERVRIRHPEISSDWTQNVAGTVLLGTQIDNQENPDARPDALLRCLILS